MPDDNKDDHGKGPDLTAAIQALLVKHDNNASAAINQLLSENFKLREDKRKLKEAADAKVDKPAEGSVILTKAEAERWEAYKLLGKPDDVKAALAERDTLKAENAKAQRKELLRSVAEVEGFDPDVLTSLAANDLGFEVKEVKDKEGKALKQAFVIIKSGDKQESKALTDYANETWQKFLPALKPSETPEKKSNSSGTPYVPQKKGEPPREPDRVAEERKRLLSRGDYQL